MFIRLTVNQTVGYFDPTVYFNSGSHRNYYGINTLAVRVRVDERGRIVIPREIREELGIQPGNELLLEVAGDKIIVKKKYDPFRKLALLLGRTSFDRSIRVRAEEQALEEIDIDVGEEKRSP